MAMQDNFRNDPAGRGPGRWMWWLFVVVGCFVVCLLIWLFMEMGKDNSVENSPVPAEYPIEQTTGPLSTGNN